SWPPAGGHRGGDQLASMADQDRTSDGGRRPDKDARVATPANPAPHQELEWREMRPGSRPGANYVRIGRHKAFRRTGAGYLLPEPESAVPRSNAGRLARGLKRILVGAPLASEEELGERTGKLKGLAIFASDNISSSAYASEEIMRILVLAGIGALSLTLPLTLFIICVLAIVVVSYRQVLFAYP